MLQRPTPKGLVSDARGAVYVEFLIAFLPVFVFFLCVIQLSLLFSAKLIVEHASVKAARAAAVVFGDDPAVYGESAAEMNVMTEKKRDVVRKAAVLTLAPLILDHSLVGLDVIYPKFEEPGGKPQPDKTQLAPMTFQGPQMLRVRLEAQVACKISIADAIICGGLGNTVRGVIRWGRFVVVRAESIFPYQGARYEYPSK